jgi:hypothetical protein
LPTTTQSAVSRGWGGGGDQVAGAECFCQILANRSQNAPNNDTPAEPSCLMPKKSPDRAHGLIRPLYIFTPTVTTRAGNINGRLATTKPSARNPEKEVTTGWYQHDTTAVPQRWRDGAACFSDPKIHPKCSQQRQPRSRVVVTATAQTSWARRVPLRHPFSSPAPPTESACANGARDPGATGEL